MIEPFIAMIGMFFGLLSLIGLALTIYVIYDVLAQQPEMQPIEKLIWIIVALFFNIIGVLVYFLVVKYADAQLFDNVDLFTEDQKLDELERLADLKDRGAITEEEYLKEKEQILGEREDTPDAAAAENDESAEDTENQ